MGRRGVVRAALTGGKLRVELACPVDALAAARPPVPVPAIDVSLEDDTGGNPLRLGTIRPEGSAWRAHDLAVPEEVSAALGGRAVRIVLASDTTWKPAAVRPGSRDERELSVEVFRIGFVKE